MDYGKAFTFFTEDEKWVTKLLIAGLLAMFSFLIIPAFLLYGYGIELLQNVMRGDARPLPAWDNMEGKLRKGLNVFAIRFVYALPLILVACCYFAINIGLTQATGSSSRSNDSAVGIISLLAFCLTCFSLIYGIALAVVLPAAELLYATNERLQDAFQLRAVSAFIQHNANTYIVAVLLSIVAGFIAGFGTIACFIGVFFTVAWAQFVASHLLGQVYRNASGAMPPDLTPPAPLPTAPAAPSM